MRLTFLPDGTVQVRTGKVELGQGISTALAQIAADELGLAPQQVRMLAADTMFGPDEGMTSGSLSVQDAGAALRRACRESGKARPLAEGSRPVVGQSMPRLDLPAKFAGAPSFIHDLDPAGLLHGCVLHPPQPDALLLDADGSLGALLEKVRASPGAISARRDGQLLGVLAESSADADRAPRARSPLAKPNPLARYA